MSDSTSGAATAARSPARKRGARATLVPAEAPRAGGLLVRTTLIAGCAWPDASTELPRRTGRSRHAGPNA